MSASLWRLSNRPPGLYISALAEIVFLPTVISENLPHSSRSRVNNEHFRKLPRRSSCSGLFFPPYALMGHFSASTITTAPMWHIRCVLPLLLTMWLILESHRGHISSLPETRSLRWQFNYLKLPWSKNIKMLTKWKYMKETVAWWVDKRLLSIIYKDFIGIPKTKKKRYKKRKKWAKNKSGQVTE